MREALMSFATHELTIVELKDALSAASPRPLARPAQISIHFTDLPDCDYTSALLVSPLNATFLYAPPGVFEFTIPASRPSARRVRWLQARADDRSSRRRFLQALRRAAVPMNSLPYGSLAYLAPDMGLDENWSKRLGPLWPGWYRVYAFPRGAEMRDAFTEAMEFWFSGTRVHGLRTCADELVRRGLDGEVTPALLRDRALFSAEPDAGSPQETRREFEALVDLIESEAERAQSYNGLTIADLSATFQPGDCLFRLVDHGVKDERRRLGEALGKYRAHLVRALGWPIFIEAAAAELEARARVGRVLPAYGSEPCPYDGWSELQQYLHTMREAHPDFFTDPFEPLYTLN
jgi:hypothetical protein